MPHWPIPFQYPNPSPCPPSYAEMGHIGDELEEEVLNPRTQPATIRRPAAGATLEERRDYGQYLVSGRGKFVSFLLYPFAN